MLAPSIPQQVAVDNYLAGWNAAGAVWDCKRLADFYTDDGLFFGGRPGHSVGREAIGAYFRSYIGTIAACRLKLRDQHVVSLDADRFVAQGFGEFSFMLADGLATQSVVRTTLMLVRQHDTWKARLWNFAPSPEKPPLGRED